MSQRQSEHAVERNCNKYPWCVSGDNLKIICSVLGAVVTAVILSGSCAFSSVLALFENHGTVNKGHEISTLCNKISECKRYELALKGSTL